jgi:prepilin-type N-terminal cleavage/methylation domain-containing protein
MVLAPALHFGRAARMSNLLPNSSARGFTLVEVLISIALFVTVSIGIVQLFGVAVDAGRGAREQTTTAIVAAAKMEQLRSLAWAYDPPAAGVPPVPRADETTNLGNDPPTDDGPGLRPSPSGALSDNVPHYVDYLDAHGTWVGTGVTAPAGTAFIRRWAVRPLPSDPGRTLILQVLVTTARQEFSRVPGSWSGRTGSETLLVSVRTRKTE